MYNNGKYAYSIYWLWFYGYSCSNGKTGIFLIPVLFIFPKIGGIRGITVMSAFCRCMYFILGTVIALKVVKNLKCRIIKQEEGL